MKSLKPRWVVLLAIISTMLLIMPISACRGDSLVKRDLAKHLEGISATKLYTLRADYPKYTTVANEANQYESRVKKAESLASLDLTGYYELSGFRGIFRHWRRIDSTGKLGSPSEITEEDIVDSWVSEKNLPYLNDQLRWARYCESYLPPLASKLKLLESLPQIWEANYKAWSVTKRQGELYLVVGDGLGLRQGEPCIGQWYFSSVELKVFRPADSYAEALLAEIQNGATYKEARNIYIKHREKSEGDLVVDLQEVARRHTFTAEEALIASTEPSTFAFMCMLRDKHYIVDYVWMSDEGNWFFFVRP